MEYMHCTSYHSQQMVTTSGTVITGFIIITLTMEPKGRIRSELKTERVSHIQKMGSNNENFFDQICIVSRKDHVVVWGAGTEPTLQNSRWHFLTFHIC